MSETDKGCPLGVEIGKYPLPDAGKGKPGTAIDDTHAVCFTTGTAIRTPQGPRLIEDLQIGDRVDTMDNGPQPIRWIAQRHLNRAALRKTPSLSPVLIRKGIMGATRDLLVSPHHGMLLGKDYLTRAKDLAEAQGTDIRVVNDAQSVTYIHLLFDAHQIIFAEDSAAESFYPDMRAQATLDTHSKEKLRARFPNVVSAVTDKSPISKRYGVTARLFLPKRTAPGGGTLADCHAISAKGVHKRDRL